MCGRGAQSLLRPKRSPQVKGVTRLPHGFSDCRTARCWTPASRRGTHLQHPAGRRRNQQSFAAASHGRLSKPRAHAEALPRPRRRGYVGLVARHAPGTGDRSCFDSAPAGVDADRDRIAKPRLFAGRTPHRLRRGPRQIRALHAGPRQLRGDPASRDRTRRGTILLSRWRMARLLRSRRNQEAAAFRRSSPARHLRRRYRARRNGGATATSTMQTVPRGACGELQRRGDRRKR